MLQMSNLSCIVAGPLGLHAIIPSVIASCKQTYQDVIYPLHDHTDHNQFTPLVQSSAILFHNHGLHSRHLTLKIL